MTLDLSLYVLEIKVIWKDYIKEKAVLPKLACDTICLHDNRCMANTEVNGHFISGTR